MIAEESLKRRTEMQGMHLGSNSTLRDQLIYRKLQVTQADAGVDLASAVIQLLEESK